MSALLKNSIVIFILMVSASLSSVALTPTKRVVDGYARVSLDSLLPIQFGDWKIEVNGYQSVVNPQAQEFINQLYSETLSRTYVNSEGRRVMLSLAYGADQSHDNQIHKPEVCYPAQGFQIISRKKDMVRMADRDLPVMRVTTEI